MTDASRNLFDTLVLADLARAHVAAALAERACPGVALAIIPAANEDLAAGDPGRLPGLDATARAGDRWSGTYIPAGTTVDATATLLVLLMREAAGQAAAAAPSPAPDSQFYGDMN